NRDVRGRGVAGGVDLHAVGEDTLVEAQRRDGDAALCGGGYGRGRCALSESGGGQAEQQGRGAGGQDQAGLHGRQVPVAPRAAPGAGGPDPNSASPPRTLRCCNEVSGPAFPLIPAEENYWSKTWTPISPSVVNQARFMPWLLK